MTARSAAISIVIAITSNAGAQHRRFAVSINLNNNFEGCDLMFPEFGRKVYRPSEGGALVFSCGACIR